MRRFPVLLLCLPLFLLPTACLRTPRILIADPESFPLLGKLADRHPLPPGWLLRESGREKTASAAEITMRRRTWEDRSPGAVSSEARRLTAGRAFYAPAVPLWHAADDIRLGDLPPGGPRPFDGTLGILPVERIEPPLRALPVDGTFPGDEGYPLVETTELLLSARDPALLEWFSELERVGRHPDPTGDRVIWIAAAGDVMPGRGVSEQLRATTGGPERVFTDLLPDMRQADLLLANLEGAVTRRGSPADKTYTFRFAPEVLPPLRAAGFDYLSVTNNHAFDYGTDGFLDTLDNLREAGLGTSGAGRNSGEAALPWTTEVRGQKITVLSLAAYPVERSGWNGKKEARAGRDTPGMLWEGEAALEAVKSVAGGQTFDIVMVHGGEEWLNRPTASQRSLYRALVDSGADIVIGTHPHVLQGIEAWKGRPIVHSLGNYVFPGMSETRFGEDSLLLFAGVYRGAVRYWRFVPARIDGVRVRRDDAVLERFLTLTRLENPGR